MKKRVNLMCALALVASLAACAPVVQGPGGQTYQPKTQLGMGMLFVERVPVAELNETTPDTSYVSFPDCFNVVVSVVDVRQLGVEQARQVCQDTGRNFAQGLGILGGIAAGLSLVVGALLIYVLSLLSPDF